MAEKLFQLRLGDTLDTLEPGESVCFLVSGPGREATLESVRTAANQRGLSCSVGQDGVFAVVTNRKQSAS